MGEDKPGWYYVGTEQWMHMDLSGSQSRSHCSPVLVIPRLQHLATCYVALTPTGRTNQRQVRPTML